MKTKVGKCEKCLLSESKKYSNSSFISNNNDVGELDYYIVCDAEKDASNLVDFFTDINSEYKLDFKYGISDKILCDRTGFTLSDECVDICTQNCALNFAAIAKKCNAKKKYLIGIKYELDMSQYGFVFLKDFQEFKKLIESEYKKKDEKKYYSFQIPSKYYTNEFRLVDVQYISNQEKLIYIFRDRDNKKSFYEFPAYENDFYWYEATDSNRIIEDIDKLKLVTGKFKNRNRSIRAYGGDVNIATQHTVDYFLNSKEEAPIVRQNVMFFDIETYQYCTDKFPNPDKAEYPITAISFRTDNPEDKTVHVYLLNLKGEIDSKVTELIKSGNYPYITLFDDEATMLRAFFQKIHCNSIDFLCGWNVSGFDIPYIVNRMRKLEIDAKELSPFGNVYADKTGRNIISGYIILDQLKLFKDLVQQTQPSYSLNAIATSVLGKEKIQHEESIDEMYHLNIKKFMDYSQRDTELIYEIEQEEGHIALQDEIRRVTTCCHEGANSTIGQADGLYATELKKKGRISRNYTYDVPEVKFDGAYVYDSLGGLFIGLLCDFDYKSLYPTTICTWNIGNDTYIGKVDQQIARLYVFDRDSLKGKKIRLTIDPIHANKTVEITFEQFEGFIQKYHAQIALYGTIFCGHDIHTAANVQILTMLMDSRSIYKKRMLNAKEAGNTQQTVEYNNKQLAFKVTANALYGVLGAKWWRFYCPDLGATITSTGQEMLKYAANRVYNYIKGNISETNHPIDPNFEKKAENVNDVIIYGDTDSIMVNLTSWLEENNLPLKNCPEVLQKINKLQDFYNKIALPQLLKLHNINLSKSMMYLKNEFLFSRYYSLEGCKHYASKVISQEGHDVSYIDIKGLEIKRSEIPSMSQKLLSEIIDAVMNEKIKKFNLKEETDKIGEKYKKLIEEALTKHDCCIARVVAFSKEIEEYKTMPQHIKGMMLWNDLVGKEDFKHGTKGKLWNILGIDIDKAPKEVKDNYYGIVTKKYNSSEIKCICTPEEIEILPDWCIIDNRKMFEYAYTDRLENLLAPLWKESDNDSDLLF